VQTKKHIGSKMKKTQVKSVPLNDFDEDVHASRRQIAQFEARLAEETVLRTASKRELRLITSATSGGLSSFATAFTANADLDSQINLPTDATQQQKKSVVRAELVKSLRSIKRTPIARVEGVNLGPQSPGLCSLSAFPLSRGTAEILAFFSNGVEEIEFARLVLTKEKIATNVIPQPPKRAVPSIPDPSTHKDVLMLPSEAAQLQKRFHDEQVEIIASWDAWLRHVCTRLCAMPWQDDAGQEMPRFDLLIQPVKIDTRPGSSWKVSLSPEDFQQSHDPPAPDPQKITLYFKDT